MKILLCGDGNGGHVFSCLAASNPDVQVNILSLYAPVREAWQEALKNGAVLTVHCHNPDGSKRDVKGNPEMITDDPAKAMAGVEMIVFMNPAFTHYNYLEQLEPFVKPGMVVVGLPGQAGFEFAIRKVWKEKRSYVNIIAYESLPWACKMSEIGKEATVFGFKDELRGGSLQLPETKESTEKAVALLQKILGPLPTLKTEYHLLGICLNTTNLVLHTGIMYGQWSRWDGKPIDHKPFFYWGVNQLGADTCENLSKEVVATAQGVMKRQENTDLTNVTSIYDWLCRTYADEIGDKTNLYTVFRSNIPYKTFTHPLIDQGNGTYLPDWNVRYFTEDVTFGLVPVRGVAQLMGLETPTMDKVITWAQGLMGKEYLVGGKLSGKDIGETSSPQACGLSNFEKIMKA